MSLLVIQKRSQWKITLITWLFTGGGVMLIAYTFFDWLILKREIYTGYSENFFTHYLVFLSWLFFSVSFYLLKKWVFKEGVLIRSGLMTTSVGLFFISFAYFFNDWIDGVSFPGFVVSFFPGTIITALGLILCIIGASRNKNGLKVKGLFCILFFLLLSAFLPLHFFSSTGDKATATMVRSIGHILLDAAFVMGGPDLVKGEKEE